MKENPDTTLSISRKHLFFSPLFAADCKNNGGSGPVYEREGNPGGFEVVEEGRANTRP